MTDYTLVAWATVIPALWTSFRTVMEPAIVPLLTVSVALGGFYFVYNKIRGLLG